MGGQLRHLFLAGNPMAVLPSYRERVLASSASSDNGRKEESSLLVLDDIPVSKGEQAAAPAAVAAALAAVIPKETHSNRSEAEGELSGNAGEWRSGGVALSSNPVTRSARLREAFDTIHFGVKVLVEILSAP